jgi:hypothetical protein
MTGSKARFLTILSGLALIALLAGQVLAKEFTVRGRLQKTVESGAWLIVAGHRKYLILNAKPFQSKKWFTEGTKVEAVGETRSDVMTTYMEGTPLEVRTMRPLVSSKVKRPRRLLPEEKNHY